MSLIEVDNLTIKYRNNYALKNVSLKVDLGEIVTIVGPNGSGKTSLLRSIIGSVAPETGSIRLKAGLKIGYVPQRLNFDRTLPMTVHRFLNLSARVNKPDCISALEKAGLSQNLTAQMSELSGGQLQRVLLARALLGHPELLLLDEATQGLDQPGSYAFYRQIEKLRHSEGCAILMISHDMHVVMRASDRVFCFNGHICCSGTPYKVLNSPEYQEIFGKGLDETMALYRHQHVQNSEDCDNKVTATDQC